MATSTSITNGWSVVESTGLFKSLFNLGTNGEYDYNRDWGSGTTLKEGSIWKIWTLGDSGATETAPGHHSRLGYATSTDGINWTKYVGSKFGGSIFEDFSESYHGINGGCVLKDNGVYYFWYSPMYSDQMKLATSTDGINWSISGYCTADYSTDKSISGVGFGSLGNIIKVGSTYYLVCNALNKNGFNGLAIYTSTDKMNWKYQERISMYYPASAWQNGYIAAPTLYQDDDGQVYMFYQAAPEGAQNNSDTLKTIKIGLAKLKTKTFSY